MVIQNTVIKLNNLNLIYDCSMLTIFYETFFILIYSFNGNLNNILGLYFFYLIT
jgi:hypothetical protein